MLNTVQQTVVKQLPTLQNNKRDKQNIYKKTTNCTSLKTFQQVLQISCC